MLDCTVILNTETTEISTRKDDSTANDQQVSRMQLAGQQFAVSTVNAATPSSVLPTMQ